MREKIKLVTFSLFQCCFAYNLKRISDVAFSIYDIYDIIPRCSKKLDSKIFLKKYSEIFEWIHWNEKIFLPPKTFIIYDRQVRLTNHQISLFRSLHNFLHFSLYTQLFAFIIIWYVIIWDSSLLGHEELKTENASLFCS